MQTPLFRVAAIVALLAPMAAIAAPSTLQVGSTTYEHRWSDGALHEYSPHGQDDLDHYRELLTLAPSPADYGPADMQAYADRMARVARERGGDVVSNECAAATATHVADCTLLTTYSRDGHVEIAVAKHLAVRDAIVPILLAHREYGDGSGARAQAWLASDDGRRTVAEFIDWVDGVGLAMDAR